MTRRRRAKIQFVRHGLFQKLHKETRVSTFGNPENALKATLAVLPAHILLHPTQARVENPSGQELEQQSCRVKTLIIDIRSPHPKLSAKHFSLVHPDDDVMKLSPGITIKAMAVCALAAFLTVSTHAETRSREAIVTAVAGDARYSAGGSGAFSTVAIGTKLHEGDVLKTAAGSHIDVDLGNNVGLLQVAPKSTLALQTMKVTDTQADTVTETDLDLKEGAIFFK